MRALVVVVMDPRIELCLGIVDRCKRPARKELTAQRLVEAFDLAGRGRRARRGEQVGDAVVAADAVEQDLSGSFSEAIREYLAVEFPIAVKPSRRA